MLRPVSALIRILNRFIDFGDTTHHTFRPLMKLYPRNLRVSGRATALFFALTFSFSLWLSQCVNPAM
ncbi:hypothetical protein, partial [Escherichia marmotae]|uniref:hypothetical protein n=1 Tax=Escherichia marmotae TaxID=1499973 RepID=UPI0021C1063C